MLTCLMTPIFKFKNHETQINYKLADAPILPLIRIGLRGRVPQQTLDRVFMGAVFVALGHGGIC
jgi:hypothetical protein